MSEFDDHEFDQQYEDANAGDKLPDCTHCGEPGATRREYLESGPHWFHQRCWLRLLHVVGVTPAKGEG
jgi:hypothetical protein